VLAEAESQSVLAISVPEADGVLNRIRSIYAGEVPPRGANAHITIQYPWMPPALITEQAILDLTTVFSGFPCFDFSLQLGWFGHEVLLLVPENPAPFVRLTEAVLDRWPEYPYYGGEHSQIEPHVSLAYGKERNLWDLAEQLADCVPLHGRATHITLSAGIPGAMTCRARFPLTMTAAENPGPGLPPGCW